MRIMGVDAALRHTGIALLHGEDPPELWTLEYPRGAVRGYVDAVRSWCWDAAWCSPDNARCVIEWPVERYSGRKSQTRTLAFCAGVWSVFFDAEVLDPNQWAKRLWGHGRADTSTVWQTALKYCQARNHPGPADEHQADAICIALSATAKK